MFNFIKTTVLNSTKDASGKPMYYHIDDSVDKFGISRFGEFHKECIVSIFHKAPKDAVLGKFKFKVPSTLTKGDYVLSFSTSYNGEASYNTVRWDLDHGWKHSYDFKVLSDNEAGTEIAKRIMKIVEVEDGMNDGEGEFTGAVNTDEITFTSKTPYMAFVDAKLSKVNDETGLEEVVKMYESYDAQGKPQEVDGSLITLNDEGFGTFENLIRGVAIPNCENTGYLSTDKGRQPIEGAKYHQYIINYSVYRPGLGGLSAVGQEITTSSQFSIWVNDAIHTDFESAFKTSFAKEMVKDLTDGEEFKVEVTVAGNTNKRQKTKKVSDNDDYKEITK